MVWTASSAITGAAAVEQLAMGPGCSNNRRAERCIATAGMPLVVGQLRSVLFEAKMSIRSPRAQIRPPFLSLERTKKKMTPRR